MLKYLLSVFILLPLVLSGCSSSNCAQSFGPGSPSGVPGPFIRQIVTVDVRYLDGVPIADVAISSDNPAVRIGNAGTDMNGYYTFELNVPDGTVFSLNFSKPGHVISSDDIVTVGTDGIHEGNTIIYPVFALGYIPLDDDSTEGRSTDFFAENIGIYNAPMDTALSPDGKKLYVSDSFNHRIRVVDMESGFLSTLAGSAISGYQEGFGAEARFWEPMGLALTSDGKTLYVSDQMNNCIRKIDTSTAEVSLVAGTPGSSGNQIGPNLSAKFNNTGMIALSTDESFLYVADSQNRIIRKIDLVGGGGVSNVGGAFPGEVYGVCVANDGAKDILYIAATFDYKIYSMDTQTGIRTFIAGSSDGWLDGAGAAAKFSIPVGIAVSTDRNYIYVSDNSTSTIRKIDLANGNMVSTLSSSTPGYSEGPLPEFLSPAGLKLFNNDAEMFIADTSNNRVRIMDMATGVSRKHSGGGRAGFVDGPPGESSLSFNGNIYSVILTDDSRTMYVSDIKSVWKIDVDTRDAVEIAGSCYVGTAYMYNLSYGYSNRATSHKIVLSLDEKTIYIADSTSNMIRSIDISSGASTVIAGNTTAGYKDDTAAGSAVRFNQPNGLALSKDGNFLYVSDGKNHRIRKVNIATGATTTIAGSSPSFADSVGILAKFNLPTDVVLSPDGSRLYVADSYNHRVRMIDLSDNNVTTIAGNASAGRQDGIGTAAVFDEPRGLALTSDGNLLFVTDCRGANIRRIKLATMAVATYAGGAASGFADGTGEEALFYNLDGLTVSRDSSQLFIADNWNSMIRRVVASYFGTY